jgi:hypothetical protein
MNYFFCKEDEKLDEYKNNEENREKEYSEDSEETEDDKYSKYSEESIEQELQCKNIDPSLAKLMGIIIEEQKMTDWLPPKKSGLDNSEEIISSIYFKNKNKNTITNVDFFQVIKDDIQNYKTLTYNQIQYIKNTSNEEKFELIEIYNKLINANNYFFK